MLSYPFNWCALPSRIAPHLSMCSRPLAFGASHPPFPSRCRKDLFTSGVTHKCGPPSTCEKLALCLGPPPCRHSVAPKKTFPTDYCYEVPGVRAGPLGATKLSGVGWARLTALGGEAPSSLRAPLIRAGPLDRGWAAQLLPL